MKTTDEMVSGLDPYKAPFKEAVLQHIHREVGKIGWAKLRQQSQRHYCFENEIITVNISPEEPIDQALDESSVDLRLKLQQRWIKIRGCVILVLFLLLKVKYHAHHFKRPNHHPQAIP